MSTFLDILMCHVIQPEKQTVGGGGAGLDHAGRKVVL